MRFVFLFISAGAVLTEALPRLAARQTASSDSETSLSTTSTTSSDVSSTTSASSTMSTSSIPKVTGIYDLPPMPNICKNQTVPLSATVHFNSSLGQVEAPGAIWSGDKPFNWTFSTNTPGVVFGSPWIPGNSYPHCSSGTKGTAHCFDLDSQLQARTKSNSFTLSMTGADQVITQIYWMVWKQNGTTNGTTIPTSVWNTSDTQKLDTKYTAQRAVQFDMTVSGTSPCAHPTGNMSCADGSIPRTADAWTAFDVDGFLSKWMKDNKQNFTSTNGMMQAFASQFQVSQGTGSTCNIEHDCNVLSTCKNLPANGNSTEDAQVYLAWVALENLSDFYGRIWQALNIAQADVSNTLPSMIEQFWAKDPPPTAPGQNPLSEAGSILGVIGTILGIIPGPAAKAGSGIVKAASGILGFVGDRETKNAAPPAIPDPIANLSSLSTYLGNFVLSTRGHLLDSYNDTFTTGNNVLESLHGGAFVNRTDLQLDNVNMVKGGVAAMDQYLGLKTLNMAWWANNVFITYVPYGKVVQVGATDGSGGLGTTDFDEGACVSNFQQKDWSKDGWSSGMKDEKTLTVCNTDKWNRGNLPPGMARLTWYNPSDQDPTPHNSDGYLTIFDTAPGATKDVTFNTTAGSGWKLNVADVVQSSIESWAKDGYGWAGGVNASSTAAHALSVSDFKPSAPNSAGSFTLPVCVLNNLNQWPNLYQVDGSGAWSSPGKVDTYCVCARTTDMHGVKMASAVPSGFADRLKDPPSLPYSQCMQADIYGANELDLPKM